MNPLFFASSMKKKMVLMVRYVAPLDALSWLWPYQSFILLLNVMCFGWNQ